MSPDDTQIPVIGTRISHSGHRGTIKYVGEVYGTTGIWLGIEWDDPKRGKHDGVKDGKRYFSCRFPNSGSFIRPSASINYGTSFLRALISKYGDSQEPEVQEHSSMTGSSKIKIEVVGMEKVRARLSKLQNLREVGLDGENVTSCDPPGEIRKLCLNIRGMDLSLNLLPSWDILALITIELPILERLALNQNRLQPSQDVPRMRIAFPKLMDIQLNSTLMTWQEMQEVTALMPNLRRVEFGYNQLTTLDISSSPQPTVQTLNLDNNKCHSWLNICQALQCYSSLQRLILTSNHIESISPSPKPEQRLQNLRHLSLSFNRLGMWSDVDTLFRWCPAIETLSLMGNPLVEDPDLGRYWRQFTIARMPTLITLDSTAITHKERIDSELFYMSCIVQKGPLREEDRSREHPRWPDLCSKHGKPDESTEAKLENKLSNRLIDVTIRQVPTRPLLFLSYDHSITTSSVFRVLPSMPLRNFRLKIRKAIKPLLAGSNVKLWLKMEDGQLVPLDSVHDDKDLAWLGVENGSIIVFYIEHKE